MFHSHLLYIIMSGFMSMHNFKCVIAILIRRSAPSQHVHFHVTVCNIKKHPATDQLKPALTPKPFTESIKRHFAGLDVSLEVQ